MSGRRVGQLIAGRLQEHGPAHFRFQPSQDLSYYLRLLTSGRERIVWGKDLQRALHAGTTQPKVGDLIGVRLAARESVIRTEPLHGRDGRLLSKVEHKTYRNRWEVEKLAYFTQRATLARRVRDAQADTRRELRTRPELKSTFLSIRAAQAFAEARIADLKDRERFVEWVRGAIAGSIHKGEPVPEVRMKETAQTAAHAILSLRTQARSNDRTR